MQTLTVKITEAAMADLKNDARMVGISLSELVRQRLGVTPSQLNHSDDRYDDHERRISRLEEMAGL